MKSIEENDGYFYTECGIPILKILNLIGIIFPLRRNGQCGKL